MIRRKTGNNNNNEKYLYTFVNFNYILHLPPVDLFELHAQQQYARRILHTLRFTTTRSMLLFGRLFLLLLYFFDVVVAVGPVSIITPCSFDPCTFFFSFFIFIPGLIMHAESVQRKRVVILYVHTNRTTTTGGWFIFLLWILRATFLVVLWQHVWTCALR